jgi:uncharacterized protein with von Willebrand factor type A (vWA) domain
VRRPGASQKSRSGSGAASGTAPVGSTLEDGRMYRNAFGLDPLVISRTLEEVSRCKRQGI